MVVCAGFTRDKTVNKAGYTISSRYTRTPFQYSGVLNLIKHLRAERRKELFNCIYTSIPVLVAGFY